MGHGIGRYLPITNPHCWLQMGSPFAALARKYLRGTPFRMQSALQIKNTTKNVVQYDKAFGLLGYGQITWDFQTGPCIKRMQ